MIVDARDFPAGHSLEADVCIVGAGAAGITLALELMGCSLSVVVLESGGFKEEAQTQALYEGTVADEALHSPINRYRQRLLGGSTTIWGGRCMPFDPVDFEVRSFVPHSGWPFPFEELEPHYERANRLCEAGEFTYRIEQACPGATPAMIEGFSSPHFTSNTLERFSCPTNFGTRYRHKLEAARNVRVIIHANVTAIALNESGTAVTSLDAATLQGGRFSVKARQYVLAAGGLEVVRLLLANRDVHKSGIGNDRDVVGRYYMCHIAGTIGNLEFSGPPQSVHHGYDVSDEGIYCRRRLALTREAQQQFQLGNFVARLHHPRITDPAHRTGILSLLFLAQMFIPYEYGKRLHGEEKASVGTWLQHVRNVVADPFYTIAFLWHWLRDRTLQERKFPSVIIRPRANRYSLDFHAEQEPNPSSRITLGAQTDALGVPKLHVDWRYTEGDVRTVCRSLKLLADEVVRSRVGRFDYDPRAVEKEMTRYGAYGGHHIGTARMGTDAAASVVDPDCRVHGVANLFIAGAAVFPTSSQANPTLTIVAMALRLAEHLVRVNSRPLPSIPVADAAAAMVAS